MSVTKVKNRTKLVILSDLHPQIELGGGGAIAYEFFNLLDNIGYSVQFWFTTSQREFINNHNHKEIEFFHLIQGLDLGVNFVKF